VEAAAVPPPVVPAAPAEEERPVPQELYSWSWSSISVAAGRVAQVRQIPSAKAQCRVSATLGSEKVWSIDGCLAMREDLRFVSPDANALLVLKQRPDLNDGDFGALYRKGNRIVSLTATSLHLPATATHIEGYSLAWLGTREPRDLPDGVELQLHDGSLLTIGFDGHVAPRAGSASVAAAPAAPMESCSPCTYTDSDGVYHIVDSADDVPPQYRSVAGRIRGSIQHAVVVPHEPLDPSSADYGFAPSARSVPPRPAPQAPDKGGVGPDGIYRNELGEDFEQYSRRLRGFPVDPRTLPQKCNNEYGAKVACTEPGARLPP